MTSIPPPPVVIDLGITFGPILIGHSLAQAFWGIHCLQTVYYFMNYTEDHPFVKVWVVLLWCLDTAHQLIVIKGIWKPLIADYGDYIRLLRISPELVVQTLLTAVAAFMAQCFFMRRIYVFSKLSTHTVVKWVIPALLAPLVVWQMVGTIMYTTRGLSFESSAQLSTLEKIAIGINAAAAAVDIVIALTMCVLLYVSRNGMAATDRLLKSLMISSFNTGAWTALFAIINVALVAGRPNDLFYTITYLPICALYCNSILGNLISRNFMRQTGKQRPQTSALSSNVPLYTLSAGRYHQSAEKKSEAGKDFFTGLPA